MKIFATDRWDLYAVVQSTLHEVWARKYSGALETRLRYSPSDCFETFAFPEGLWQTANPALAAIGERYHEHRKSLMLSLWLGLTDIYNLFHARDLSPAKVAKSAKSPPKKPRAATKDCSNYAAFMSNSTSPSATPTAGRISPSTTTSTKSKPLPKTTASATPSAPPPAKKSCAACLNLITHAQKQREPTRSQRKHRTARRPCHPT